MPPAGLSKIGDVRLDSAKEHAAIQPPVPCGMAIFGKLDLKLAQHAVLLDMVSAANSLVAGNLQGIYPFSDGRFDSLYA